MRVKNYLNLKDHISYSFPQGQLLNHFSHGDLYKIMGIYIKSP